MGPVDKRKVCVCVWILQHIFESLILLYCIVSVFKKRHILVLYTILPARLCGVFQFELATDQWSHFPLLFTAVKWEVKGDFPVVLCKSVTGLVAPSVGEAMRCLHSFAGSVRPTETAASHWRTTPVLRGSCQQGPEGGDSLVLRVTPRGQELQNLLCSHGTQLLICDAFLTDLNIFLQFYIK